MKQVLIHLRPFDRAAGVRRDVRIGDGPNGEIYGALGQAWEPALVVRPQLSIELFNLDLDGGVATGKAQFVVQLGSVTSVAAPLDLYWKGAPVTIYSDEAGQAGGGVEFEGYVRDATPDADTGRMTVTAEVSDTLLDKPLLTASFTGGGGIGGDAGRRGVLLPAGFGSVKNIEPVWFDLTRNIGMIDGYDNTVSIDWLGEGLSSFGPAVADYPSYAALAAAIDARDVKPGEWAKCTAKGLVGLGAPPVAPITVHAVFGSNRIGAIIRRICTVHAGISNAMIDVAAFNTVDAILDLPVHYWTSTDRNVKDLAEALARSANAALFLSFQGKITITRAIPSAPVLTIDRGGGGSPRVIRWRAGSVPAPYFQIRARSARPARVLRLEEVNYKDTIEDKGLYLGTESYRAGNIVWLSDGSQWLYISDDVTSGNSPTAILPPATSNAYWRRLQPARVASDFRYSTGQTIESLRPAEPGANVTGTNTAAAIAGQGALATQNSVTYGTQVSGLPVALQPGQLWGGQYIVSVNTIYGNGATVESLRPGEAGANVTQTNTAAAIAGQGALATQSSADWATQVTGAGRPEDGATNDRGDDTRNDNFSPAYYRANYLRRLRTEFKSSAAIGAPSGGYGTLESYASWADASGGPVWQRFTDGGGRRYIRYSTSEAAWGGWQPEYSGNRRPTFDADLLEADGGAVATLGNFRTSLGTSAAVAGQGALATLSFITDGQLGGYLANRLAGASVDPNYLSAERTAWATGSTVEAWKPQEPGANITETRTASAIAGQGSLATQNSVTYGTQISGLPGPIQPGNFIGGNYLDARQVQYWGGPLIQSLQPAQAGADVTASHTAAAIAGQGALATLNTADWATRVTGTGRPEDYADVTATAQVTVMVADIEIAADSAGTIAGGQLPRTILPVVMRGANNIRTDAGTAYALSAISSNLAGHVSVSNVADATKGQITLAAGIGGSGSFVVTVTVGGVAYARTVTVTVRRAAPPTGGGGGGGTKSASAELVGAAVTSTSFLEIVKFTGMSAASGETVTAQLSADFYTTSNVSTSNRIIAKWQRSAAGAGSWTDIGASMVSSYASFDEFTLDGTPGSISGTRTVSPGAGSYDIRLVMSKESGPDIYINSGFASVSIA